MQHAQRGGRHPLCRHRRSVPAAFTLAHLNNSSAAGMALAARQCATSFAGRPAGLRPRVAGLFNKASVFNTSQIDCRARDCAPAERGQLTPLCPAGCSAAADRAGTTVDWRAGAPNGECPLALPRRPRWRRLGSRGACAGPGCCSRLHQRTFQAGMAQRSRALDTVQASLRSPPLRQAAATKTGSRRGSPGSALRVSGPASLVGQFTRCASSQSASGAAFSLLEFEV